MVKMASTAFSVTKILASVKFVARIPSLTYIVHRLIILCSMQMHYLQKRTKIGFIYKPLVTLQITK